MITINWIPIGLNWTILFKCLEMTIVVIWHYINKTELNWIELNQALQWPDKEPFIWIRCGGGGKHRKHAGQWVMRTGIEKHWPKGWELDNLRTRYRQNNLELSALKTVEMTVDFRESPAPPTKSLCVTLPWTLWNISASWEPQSHRTPSGSWIWALSSRSPAENTSWDSWRSSICLEQWWWTSTPRLLRPSSPSPSLYGTLLPL